MSRWFRNISAEESLGIRMLFLVSHYMLCSGVCGYKPHFGSGSCSQLGSASPQGRREGMNLLLSLCQLILLVSPQWVPVVIGSNSQLLFILSTHCHHASHMWPHQHGSAPSSEVCVLPWGPFLQVPEESALVPLLRSGSYVSQPPLGF